MKNATMLYKVGGSFRWEGESYSTIIVDEDEIEQKQKEGWSLTAQEAKANVIDVNFDGKVTRDELELKAKELHIPFNHKTTDAKLHAKIKEALNVVD